MCGVDSHVRRVGNDGNANGGKISLDLGDVALLLLAIAEVLLLVLDRGTRASHVGRRQRRGLRGRR